MFTNDRNAYRNAFFIAWEKYAKKIPLEPVEAQLIEIILLHPEYHSLLEKSNNPQQEFTPEENPYLHMSLHIAIREQIQMNRPAGIAAIHQQLMEKYSDIHDVEHRMMTCLAQIMWGAQQSGNMPNEEVYLQKLSEILQ